MTYTSTPTATRASLRGTKFRQEFQVSNGKEFNEDELIILQALYRRFTVDFSTHSATEVDPEIMTTCIVEKQSICWKQLPDKTGSGSPNVTMLTLEYTMKYGSRDYNVTHYPRTFQNWMTKNLSLILVRMQVLGFNVTEVNIPVIALSALTMGVSIDRRKRQPNQNYGDTNERNATERTVMVRVHTNIMRPERRTPISCRKLLNFDTVKQRT